MFETPFSIPPMMQKEEVDCSNFCQTLTRQQIEHLKNIRSSNGKIIITEDDRLSAICMHRDINGRSALKPDCSTNEVTCMICGKTFNLLDRLKMEDLEAASSNIIDILQTIKTLYVDMPVESAKDFFTIIALLEKVPELYMMACASFKKHDRDQIKNDESTFDFAGWAREHPECLNPYGRLMIDDGNTFAQAKENTKRARKKTTNKEV